eukprot:2991885-Prymnesium_polylepis.1
MKSCHTHWARRYSATALRPPGGRDSETWSGDSSHEHDTPFCGKERKRGGFTLRTNTNTNTYSSCAT